MARIINNNITGALGKLIFYESRGQLLVRTKPGKVRQTEGTKETAKAFGLAAKCSATLRWYLSVITQTHGDRSLMYRMNTALLHWLNASKEDPALRKENIQKLNGFELNEQVQVNRRMTLDVPVNFSQPGKIIVSMPSIDPKNDIKTPVNCSKIELMLVAVRCNTEPGKNQNLWPFFNKTIDIKPDGESFLGQDIELQLERESGDIVMVAIGVNFWKSDHRNALLEMDEKWVQGKIIGVDYVE